jgi:hypothetical protein
VINDLEVWLSGRFDLFAIATFPLIDCISVGVDRMQRNFAPMRKQVEGWQRSIASLKPAIAMVKDRSTSSRPAPGSTKEGA